MTTNNKTSLLVSSQVPDFVRQDHQTFIEFLEYYYKSMEENGELIDVTKNLARYKDIDIVTGNNSTIQQHFYNVFLKQLPTTTIADKNLILKHAKDFYRSRGTEKSIKFLLRILFDKDSEVYLPKTDILKTSDGKWYVEKALRIANVAVNNVTNSMALYNFANTTVRGSISNSTAIVERVERYREYNSDVIELKISGATKSFKNGEQIFTLFTEEGVAKHLSANALTGIINKTQIIKGGAGYTVGSFVPVESNTGSGGIVMISKTTTGSIKGVSVVKSGAGFRKSDYILVSGGGGTGARANVGNVNSTGLYHPNSYNIVATQISVEANTSLGNLVFSNLNSTNVNTSMYQAYSYWVYANCGPVTSCTVLDGGTGYSTLPTLDIQSNTIVRSLGTIGTLEIINGGLGYSTNDKIEFIGIPVTLVPLGTGAAANVVNVAANGMITKIQLESINGIDPPGGTGYTKDALPIANVISTTGYGANIAVSALIGDSEELVAITDTIGTIQKLQIIAGGAGYESQPTLNLTSLGDGTAKANAYISTGFYIYPGRFLNDTGTLSAYNFIENRDYYQNYSYVVKVRESINKYRKAVSDLVHMSGTKLFGEYVLLDDGYVNTSIQTISAGQTYYTLTTGTYAANTVTVSKPNTSNIINSNGVFIQPTDPGTITINVSNVIINITNHGVAQNDAVYLTFTSGDTANIANGYYIVTGTANANTFFVEQSNTTNTSGIVSMDVA